MVRRHHIITFLLSWIILITPLYAEDTTENKTSSIINETSQTDNDKTNKNKDEDEEQKRTFPFGEEIKLTWDELVESNTLFALNSPEASPFRIKRYQTDTTLSMPFSLTDNKVAPGLRLSKWSSDNDNKTPGYLEINKNPDENQDLPIIKTYAETDTEALGGLFNITSSEPFGIDRHGKMYSRIFTNHRRFKDALNFFNGAEEYCPLGKLDLSMGYEPQLKEGGNHGVNGIASFKYTPPVIKNFEFGGYFRQSLNNLRDDREKDYSLSASWRLPVSVNERKPFVFSAGKSSVFEDGYIGINFDVLSYFKD